MMDEPSRDLGSRPGQPLLVWGGLAIAIAAATLSALSCGSSRETEERLLHLELDDELDEAWALIGGEPLSQTIATFSYEPRRLEKAQKLVSAALARDPDLARGTG